MVDFKDAEKKEDTKPRTEQEVLKDVEYLNSNLVEMYTIDKFLELNGNQIKVEIKRFQDALKECKEELEQFKK